MSDGFTLWKSLWDGEREPGFFFSSGGLTVDLKPLRSSPSLLSSSRPEQLSQRKQEPKPSGRMSPRHHTEEIVSVVTGKPEHPRSRTEQAKTYH